MFSAHNEFKLLRDKKVSGYFTCEAAAGLGVTDALSYDEKTIAGFDCEFKRLLHARKRVQGLVKAGRFSDWWDENKATYLTRPVVRQYKEADLSLGELLDDLHLHFMGGELKKRRFNFPVRSRVAVAFGVSLTFVASKFGYLLWSLVVLGPGVQMVNSYTQTVITPLAQTASQKGSKDLGAFAGTIQAWLSNRDRLKEVSRELHETTDKLKKYDFRKLSAEQGRAKWAEFEQTYFQLFLAYNQTLPSHLRDGRGCFRDWMIFTPIGLASNLSTFDTQYWMHRNELAALAGKKLSSAQIKLKAIHQREMATAQSRIAGTLAAWKLYEFMYPEFSREPLNAKSKNDLKKSYRTFISAMRFDIYVEQFAAQIEEVLHQIDAEFILQDRLANSASLTDRVVAVHK